MEVTKQKPLLVFFLLISVVFTTCSKDNELDQVSKHGYGRLNGHEYVDLGLSVKWSTCNIGASKPEDAGNHYAWGEILTKESFSWSNYQYCQGKDSTLTKYCFNREFGYNGYMDGKYILDQEDDIAHVLWGNGWRIPTVFEYQELVDSCNWSWMSLNGVEGYKITSKKDGYTDTFIFLPVSGIYYESQLYNGDALYWLNSLVVEDVPEMGACPSAAWCFSFTINNHHCYLDINSRYFGQSVRPVCP